MAAAEQKLYVFAHIDTQRAPCGQLTLAEDGMKLLASTFALPEILTPRWAMAPGTIFST
jgi:hypothetical protein